MKRLLLAITLISSLASALLAQNCSPDVTITEPGVYPDQIDTAMADEEFNFVFQILAIEDTTTDFGGQQVNASIDSVKINSVTGLPDGFEYLCNPENCVYTHENVGCVKLTGNPTQEQAGVYSLTIKTTVYASLGTIKLPVPDSITGYDLVIKGDGSASLFDAQKEPFSIYPNPSISGIYTIGTSGPSEIVAICNIQGKMVDYEVFVSNNSLQLSLSDAYKGVYFMTINVDGNLYTHKLIN